MTLKQWSDNRWLTEYRTSSDDIRKILDIIERDLTDSNTTGLSPDWKFAIAYNAILQAATACLAACGYRPKRGTSQHYYTIESQNHTIALSDDKIALIDSYRKKRNISDYERAGTVSHKESEEILHYAKAMKHQVEEWLKRQHPTLLTE